MRLYYHYAVVKIRLIFWLRNENHDNPFFCNAQKVLQKQYHPFLYHNDDCITDTNGRHCGTIIIHKSPFK